MVAYRDDDNNGRYSRGDTVLGDTCGKYLLYANGSGTRLYWVGSPKTLKVKHGWNGYDAQKGAIPTRPRSTPTTTSTARGTALRRGSSTGSGSLRMASASG